jgi:Ca2+-binding RTX toxin-like protein
LSGKTGDDELYGSGGNDALNGAEGADDLTGGGGSDALNAGPGNDVVYAYDGVKDTVKCGKGADKVFGEDRDDIHRDCETLNGDTTWQQSQPG